MLFEINRTKLDETLEKYKAHSNTRKAVSVYQKEVAKVRKYKDELTERHVEMQDKLTEVVAQAFASTDVNQRLYLQETEESIIKELSVIDGFLDEVPEKLTAIRKEHAPAVVAAMNKDNEEIHAIFYDEVNRSVRHAIADTMDCIADISHKFKADCDFQDGLADCIYKDEVITQRFHTTSKRVMVEAPLDLGNLIADVSNFSAAKQGSNSFRSNEFRMGKWVSK